MRARVLAVLFAALGVLMLGAGVAGIVGGDWFRAVNGLVGAAAAFTAAELGRVR